MQDPDQNVDVTLLAKAAKRASKLIARSPTEQKNSVLLRAAAALRGPAGDRVLKENEQDYSKGTKSGLSSALLDRLKLDRTRLNRVAEDIESIATLPDPVGQIVEERKLPNGLQITRRRAPLGVIGIIYESRPNVTADAAALCIKSGNAVVLRGGKEAFRSNQAIAAIMSGALVAEGLPAEVATLIPTVDRRATLSLIEQHEHLDLVIPRGGESLIRFVTEHSKVPVIQHYKGVCHVYVDAEANLKMALEVVVNAKTSRPGVCNAMETLLVDASVAPEFLRNLETVMKQKDVSLLAESRALALLSSATPASETTFDTEHLALLLNVKVVDGIEGAIAHIDAHGSHHTEAIITENTQKADRFVAEVDASLVLVNASTRFNDGSQLGLGAEIGISTTKLHAYGPMGLAELCPLKWVGYGTGQVRP